MHKYNSCFICYRTVWLVLPALDLDAVRALEMGTRGYVVL
jgi:hypothetical protein